MNATPLSDATRWLTANSEAILLGALVAAILVAVMLALRWIGQKLVARDPDCRTWRGLIGRVLAKTALTFMVIAALDIVATYSGPPPRIARLVDIAFIIAFALQGAVWARELVLGLIGRRTEEAGDSTLGNASAIIRLLVSVALFAVAIIVILDNLGVNVTALVAGLGIGGIAIGLAAQGIFADLFAALAILFDRPFRKGETIRYGTTTGTVERIGLKTTRLRATTGELVVMANTKLLENEIHNLNEASQRRQTLLFSLTYQTQTSALRALPELAQPAVEAQRGCKLVRCAPLAMGASGIDCECVYDDKSRDPDTLARHKSAIVIALLDALGEGGLALAYPTQTTFTAAPDGSLVMPYAPPAKP